MAVLKAKAIADALLLLDPAKDEDWTREGAPKIEVLAALVGAPLTRADVDAVDPDFNRQSLGEAQTAPSSPHADATEAPDDSGDEDALSYEDALAGLKRAQEAYAEATDNLKAAQTALEECKDRDPSVGRRWNFGETQAFMKERQAERQKALADAVLEAQKNAPPSTISELDRTLRGQRRPIPPHPALGIKPAAQ